MNTNDRTRHRGSHTAICKLGTTKRGALTNCDRPADILLYTVDFQTILNIIPSHLKIHCRPERHHLTLMFLSQSLNQYEYLIKISVIFIFLTDN